MRTILRIIVLLCGLPAASAIAADLAPEPAPLDEFRQDQARAAAYFATGKTLYNQGDLPGALRCYQRAWWWDASLSAPVREIIPLAASLGYEDIAVRYALILADQGAATPEMLRRLALHATQQNDWEQAAKLYDQWLSRAEPAGDSFQRLLTLMEKGRLELSTNDYEAASRSFEPLQRQLVSQTRSRLTRRLAAALGGSLSMTFETFGRCHLLAERTGLASEAFAAMEALPDASPNTPYWMAHLALEKHRPLESLALLNRYFEGNGGTLGSEPYDLLLATFVQLNEAGRFENKVETLHSQRPLSPYPIAALARRASRLGNEAQARGYYQQLVDAAAPESPVQLTEALFAEAGVWLLQDAQERRQPNRVLPLLAQLCVVDPLLSLSDSTLATFAEDDAFAEELRTRVQVAADQHAREAKSSLAAHRLALALGQPDAAFALLKAALAEPDENAPSVLVQAVVDLILIDNPALAVQTLQWGRESSVLAQDDADSWYYQATAQSMVKHFDQALDAARRAAELAPKSAMFAAQAPWVLQQAGRAEQAIAAYAELIERFDGQQDADTRTALVDARRSLAYLALRNGESERSEELLLSVLDEFPRDTGALNDLAFQWADQGEHLERSLKMMWRVVEAEPDVPAYLDSLGWAQYRLGRVDEALSTIGRAVAIESATGAADPEILLHYGEVQLAAGRAEDAEKSWRDALENLSKDDQRADLGDRIKRRLSNLPQRDAEGGPAQEPTKEAP